MLTNTSEIKRTEIVMDPLDPLQTPKNVITSYTLVLLSEGTAPG